MIEQNPKPNDKTRRQLSLWDKSNEINEFIRDKLGAESGDGKTHADDIIDNAIARAKYEEKPEWTTLLLNSSKEDKVKGSGAQTNIFMNANAIADETLEKLVNVTPEQKKNKIEEII